MKYLFLKFADVVGAAGGGLVPGPGAPTSRTLYVHVAVFIQGDLGLVDHLVLCTGDLHSIEIHLRGPEGDGGQ